LPEIVAVEEPISGSTLKGSRLLYLRAPSKAFSETEKAGIVAFVKQRFTERYIWSLSQEKETMNGFAIAAIGWWIARTRFRTRGLDADNQFAQNMPAIARGMENKWYVDEAYGATIVRPLEGLSQFLWRGIDALIDGTLAIVGYIVAAIGDLLRFFQTGNVRNYALMLFLGVVVFIWVLA